jgi:hypothetical protein
MTPPHHDAFHKDTKGGRTLNPEKPEEVESSSGQGSSSVEKETVRNISWGERKVDDNEESLRLWLQTNNPKAQKKIEGTDDATNLEEMMLCSVCDQEMSKISPGINTCQECQQWVNDCKGLVENEETHTRDNMTKTQTDDETEFARIPIAGENDSDYDTDSDEYKEEEDSRLPYLDGDNRVKDNLSDTDDDEFPLIPIVHAITGTNTSDKEQENQTKVKEDGGGTFNIALTSTLVENITTPTRKKDVPPIPSFDASIAYLNRPFPEDTDAFAFLFGKRRDGIIKHHRLSPIPIHENRY